MSHTIVTDFPLEAWRLVGRVSNLAQNEIRLVLVDIIVHLGSTVSTVYTPSILVDPAPTHACHLALYRCLLTSKALY